MGDAISSLIRLLLVLLAFCIGWIVVDQYHFAKERNEFKEKCHEAGGIYVPIKHNGVYCFPKGNVINIQ